MNMHLNVRWESLEIRLGMSEEYPTFDWQELATIWHFVDSQTQVVVQQSTLTSVTLERDELTEKKATLEHKCVATQSQINSLQVRTQSTYCMSDTQKD